MDHRIKDVVGLVTQYVDQLLQFVQGFDVPTLAALLLIPVLIAALARKVVLALASALLSIVSLMLIINRPRQRASLVWRVGLVLF
jgi:K+-sensing histidine kinase KdpD